jgi:redox-sensitive bicupin YhaK (pirin superfamily)
MQIEKFPAHARGHADHGWLNTHHTFSFAGWYHPQRLHYGVLRVLNDDWVQPGAGFPKHPHQNMEIISIPLQGALQHEDSLGNKGVISTGDVQVMSAGTGVTHSEFNASQEAPVAFLQIWLFPDAKGHVPRYGQLRYEGTELEQKWKTVVAPGPREDLPTWIHQESWFYLGRFKAGTEWSLPRRAGQRSGFFLMVLEGAATVAGETLKKRDALGLQGSDSLRGQANEDAFLLAMEIPDLK